MMTTRFNIRHWAILLLVLAFANCSSDNSPSLPKSKLEVIGIQRLVNFANRAQWSFDGQWVVFDRPINGKWQVFKIKPDGSGETCLTCSDTDNPGNNGGPHMSPDGRFVVFSAEKALHPPIPQGSTLTDPGAGIYNDLAVIDVQSGSITRLTDVSIDPSAAGGTMHPRFSYDGKKIMWSDFEGASSELGDYQLAVADFIGAPTPSISNVRYFNPGQKSEMGESQGFSVDGSKIYFTCAPLLDQSDLNADICEYDLNSAELKRITLSSGINGEPNAYDEHGAVNPVFPIFAYMSSNEYGIKEGDLNFLSWLETDIWLADLSNNNHTQVTFYNTPGHPESSNGRVIVSKMGWDPTGLKLVVAVWKIGDELISTDDEIDIKIISFKESQ